MLIVGVLYVADIATRPRPQSLQAGEDRAHMSLLTSPIDGAPMRQIQRHGIEFDICPSSGGVWLDKGELEKLITLVREETLAVSPERWSYLDRPEKGDPGGDQRETRRGRGKSRLLDLFDFLGGR